MSVQNNSENHISVCDIMKGSTSEIIKKFEYQIPSLVQNYSNLYTAYLHLFDNILVLVISMKKNSLTN